jgi:iron(III) transport system ATP-binding protein
MTLGSVKHGIAEGTPLLAVIRPEDVVAHEAAHRSKGDASNSVDVVIREMEFLGSFWRARLGGPQLGETELAADFSINAVRRMSLAEGAAITVELPAGRLMAFARGGGDERLD